MEALGILLFIIIFLVQAAQKLAPKGGGGRPPAPHGPWKRAGESWPDLGKDWQWEEEDEYEDWDEPEVAAPRQLMDDNSGTLFKDRHSPIEDGKLALIKEEEAARRPVEMAAQGGETAETFTPQQLVQGVIFAEIIGAPRARRPFK